MSKPMTGTFGTCGCCDGTAAATPGGVTNRSGLHAIAYRVGDHAAFKASMLARLSSGEARFARMGALTTRNDADFSIGLIDAWAGVAEVLSFYSERFANEHYLGTATERLSVLELARLIGYRTRPGVAASTRVAFALEEGRNGLPPPVVATTLAAGLKLQSTPGPDEQAQMFETVEPLTVRVRWNALRPRTHQPQTPGWGSTQLWLAGTATQLKAGDFLLLVGAERAADPNNDNWDLRRISRVTPDFANDRTLLQWHEGLGSQVPYSAPAANPLAYAFRLRTALFGHNAPDPKTLSQDTLWNYLDQFEHDIDGDDQIVDIGDWLFTNLSNPFHLDGLHPGVTVDSWLVLARAGLAELYRVESTTESAQIGYTLNAKTTRVQVDASENLASFGPERRGTLVLAASEALTMAEAPLTTDISGDTLVLDRLLAGDDVLPDGRWIIVDEDLSDPATAQAPPELVQVSYSDTVDGLTRLHLHPPLAGPFRRGLCRVRANVALATHGESSEEILGSGDARVAHARYTLKQPPLTHVSAPTASGTASTLELRVDDLLWSELPNLYGAAPDARVYSSQQADDGSTQLLFGDGKEGARLPTGVANVRARYRRGIGLAGNLAAWQLNQLLSRPLGLKDGVNPLPASGGDDPEALTDARGNAPFTVRTLDRAVSLTDFADFARSFAGVAKASSAWLWDGRRRRVHITVAGPGGAPIPESGETWRNLLSAIHAAADPNTRVVLQGYRPARFALVARLIVHPDHLQEVVAAAVGARLASTFSFTERGFAQAVMASEVTAAMQAVPGVVAAQLGKLHRSGAPVSLQQRLLADAPHLTGDGFVAAELLTLDTAAVQLTTEIAA